MTTFNFLSKYIDNDAIVTIVNTNGEIQYTGILGDMPRSVEKNTVFVNVNGLGELNDLIITIAPQDE